MKIHTGESLAAGTPQWDWDQREKLGQRYLKDMIEDVVNYVRSGVLYDSGGELAEMASKLARLLELDGYIFKDGRLLAPEQDILDVEQEQGVLSSLYKRLSLGETELALHHLELSEEHFVSGKWDDSIANSRKFFETVLANVATKFGDLRGAPVSDSVISRPVRVRDYLEKADLLETKEKDAIAKVYGLLSRTGGHPYMAQNDQARLLRHLALTLSQFVMLRLAGSLNQAA